jgi:V/A-type H+-transporting ATPase subunit I
MKHIEITALDRDIDKVIEFLGRQGLMHFSPVDEENVSEDFNKGHASNEIYRSEIKENLEKIRSGAAYLGVDLTGEPEASSKLPGGDERELVERISGAVSGLGGKEKATLQEKKKVEEALSEARAFSNLNAPFEDLDQLSYLTLRIGRLDPARQEELRTTLGDRAVIVSLGVNKDGEPGDHVLAAASRKGRFALDTELKRLSFIPVSIPEGYKGVPGELLSGLEKRLKEAETDLTLINADKNKLRERYQAAIKSLNGSYLMAFMVEELKQRLKSTKSVYVLEGWVLADKVRGTAADLQNLTGGRIAVRSYSPDELPLVKTGKEKVPVSLDHGAFVKGFERVVFSYGAPLYGTIDPTPFVAFFFALLFGIMFGDLGQGFVLFLAGLLTGKRGPKFLASFRHFSVPLIAVGITSMIMGCLNGEVFTIEELLIAPTEAVTGLITGRPVERILTLMPLTEKGGSVTKLFYFFGFTIGVGILFNSVGLIVNILNMITLKKYEGVFFSKTGLAGLLLFWYAVSIAARCLMGMGFHLYDFIALMVPVFCIFFGPVIWRLIAEERPVLEHGLMVFIMEGFVEVLETVSTYVSNTVSFLRVGAFALSHAVLSFIIFQLSEMVMDAAGGLGGSAAALLILIFGNTVIILLEGMIVAIQVVRLQYYEFFSKFFTETGVEFAPFRFRREV